jgi:hypothetical protein
VKGDHLTARGLSYEVLKVVPAQELKNLGTLVGYLELSDKPVAAKK